MLSGTPGELERFDVLTDSPFYSRAIEMQRAYPNATFVCTTRSMDSWIDSMVFGHLGAGGLYLPRLFGLQPPPYTNTSASRRNLSRAFQLHARHVCGAVDAAPMDLRDGSDVLWLRLCDAIPPALGPMPRARCEELRRAHAAWPRNHIEVSRMRQHILSRPRRSNSSLGCGSFEPRAEACNAMPV